MLEQWGYLFKDLYPIASSRQEACHSTGVRMEVPRLMRLTGDARAPTEPKGTVDDISE
jgi:hypothetical protein